VDRKQEGFFLAIQACGLNNAFSLLSFVWKTFRFACLDTRRKQRGLVSSAGGQFDGY
jgi:hypothetical protein